MRNLKFNPIWIALLTFWIPNTISKLQVPETPKMILIWLIIGFQMYLLYIGIDRLIKSKEKEKK